MLMNGKIEQTVIQTVQASVTAPQALLTPATSLSAVGIGSMALLELATTLEERLHVELPIDRVARARTIGELIEVVNASCLVRE